MKVIFLDVDGVLNCCYSTESISGYTGIDDDKVERLKQIVDATGAEIVLSSSWRLGVNKDNDSLDWAIEYLTKKLNAYGLKIYDVTPVVSSYTTHRSEEIWSWLVDHPDVDKYVILDDAWLPDLYKYPELNSRLVKTHYYREDGGLQAEHVDVCIKILNDKY